MKKKEVEIYSDVSNMVVMRHPDREFPGSLIQGDTLHCLIQDLTEAKEELDTGNSEEASEILSNVIESPNDRLKHYKNVLKEHNCELPFIE
ncbi:DUF6959 family protein [Ketobacter sp.]